MDNSTTLNDWTGFYTDRVNSSYQNYFEDRYAPFIDAIKSIDAMSIREEGAGIGSVSKALNKTKSPKQFIFGYDLELQMVNLCRKNNPGHMFYMDDILMPSSMIAADLAVTHGVLEHFSDNQILKIFRRYHREKTRSVHYVPLDKYQVPSFGDERLLPYEHWLDLVNPKDYVLFNDGHDLILIN